MMERGRRRIAPWKLALVGVALGVPAVCSSRSGLAQTADVPLAIQVQLLSKLEAYDRSFPARAGDTARVLLLTKRGSVRSEQSATDMKAALAHVDRIGGLPHEESIVPYTGPEALGQRCRSDHPAIIFVTPGFEDDLDAIRASLTGCDVLSLAGMASYVPKGVVLGFELESGKPKLVINLEQANHKTCASRRTCSGS